MLVMWGSSKMDAICLLGLATSSRIWRGRSRERRPPVQRVGLCTLHRQQANNVTGNRQQARDAETLADLVRDLAVRETAGIKSKLLSFIPCAQRRQQANDLTSKGRRGFQSRNQVQATPPLVKTSG